MQIAILQYNARTTVYRKEVPTLEASSIFFLIILNVSKELTSNCFHLEGSDLSDQ